MREICMKIYEAWGGPPNPPRGTLSQARQEDQAAAVSPLSIGCHRRAITPRNTFFVPTVSARGGNRQSTGYFAADSCVLPVLPSTREISRAIQIKTDPLLGDHVYDVRIVVPKICMSAYERQIQQIRYLYNPGCIFPFHRRAKQNILRTWKHSSPSFPAHARHGLRIVIVRQRRSVDPLPGRVAHRHMPSSHQHEKTARHGNTKKNKHARSLAKKKKKKRLLARRAQLVSRERFYRWHPWR